MSIEAFLELHREELIAILEGKGGKIRDKKIVSIECPNCNQSVAYSFVADPSTIICNRKNNCGVNTHAKTFAPQLWSDWAKRHPATDDDPNATATAYILGRGLDPSKFEYKQTTWSEKGHKITAIAFECPWTKRRWLRFIDIPKGIEGKTRWEKGEGDAYQGQAWMNRAEVDPEAELWFTEGILNTLSLEQVGIQSASTFSATHIPSKFLEGLNKNQPIVVALDNDNAGRQGAPKLIEALKELGLTNVKVAQPPYGKDWNDLLVAGALKDNTKQETIAEAIWRGRLILAETFAEYREVYEERRHGEDGYYHGLLEYRGQTWFCSTKSGKSDAVERTQTKVCDATIRRAFTQLVEEREYNAEHRYFLQINPVGRPPRIIEASAAELVNGNQARIMLKQRADVLLLDNSTPIINALVTSLERDKAPVVRLTDRLGYDPKSRCWLFGRFLYTNEGQRVDANADGYFPHQGVRCKTSEKIISTYRPTEIKKAITLLHRIYGNTGIYALAYYVAASLKHELMEREQAFPYMSFVGPKGGGKTTLINFLNNVFFQTWEGIVAARNTTPKALSRKLYHRSSLVAPYLESNDTLINIDENSLLNAYQGGSLYDRAATSNDAETISLPFDAALAFVQNKEPFRIGPLKERVITLSFKNAKDGGVTEDSVAAMNELKLLDAAARAGIGHLIFKNIQQIRDSILGNLEDSRVAMRGLGITSPRIVYHYALLLSSCLTLLDVAGVSDEECDSLGITNQLVQLAQLKESTSDGDNDEALAFLDNFEQLRSGVDNRMGINIKVELGKHYLEDEDHYYIRLDEVIRLMRDANYPLPPINDLRKQLKAADAWYVSNDIYARGVGDPTGSNGNRTRWKSGNKERSWQFRKRLDPSISI